MIPFHRGLLLALYLGAARASLFPDRAAIFRQELAGPLEDYRIGLYDEEDLMSIVDQFMGPDWKPGKEWQKQMDALGFTRGNPGK